MRPNAIKIGYVLGYDVPPHEIGMNTGYHKYLDETNEKSVYIEGIDGDFQKIGTRPQIFKTVEDAKNNMTSMDVVYKAEIDLQNDVRRLIAPVFSHS